MCKIPLEGFKRLKFRFLQFLIDFLKFLMKSNLELYNDYNTKVIQKKINMVLVNFYRE